VIAQQGDLPHLSYRVSLPPSKLVVADDATFAPFAADVGADVDRILHDDEIRDEAALLDVLSTKLALQQLAHDDAGARATIAALRVAETQPDRKLVAGRLALVRLDALVKTSAGRALETNEATLDRAAVAALPWEVVKPEINASYAAELAFDRDRVLSDLATELDPIVAQNHAIDGVAARELVQTRAQLQDIAPLYAIDAPILAAAIAQHSGATPDIWAPRNVTIARGAASTTVVIGIWGSGVDPSAYPGALSVDSQGRHGLAFTANGSPSTSPLLQLDRSTAPRYDTYARYLTGEEDMQAGIDSPSAAAYRAYVSSLAGDDAAAFAAGFDEMREYCDGTHIAGIALRGNPAARIAIARFDDDLPNLAFAPTPAWMRRMAANFAEIGAYVRMNHVRVVNVSWSDDVAEFEAWIAKTDPDADASARAARARQLFARWRAAIRGVIAENPNTLFVAPAGSDDAASVPASLRLRNLITVGAVDQAGDATAFTRYDDAVAVYANGVHVRSMIPGGYTAALSGASIAAAQVTNLAAKLFALDPSLTSAQARALIVDGATPTPTGTLPLIDPKHSLILLQRLRTEHRSPA
jgi:hypothetical protein